VRALLLINPRAGDGDDARELAAEAQRRGIEARVLGEDDDVAAIARAAEADVLGAAGGDGSVGSVAAVAAERDLPLVVVPYGTRNHFARDLGLARKSPARALDAFGGEERRVDLGRVGERRFLNNVSLGAAGARRSRGCGRSGWDGTTGSGPRSTASTSARGFSSSPTTPTS
jgi:diacylglycerol kinase family enzyme